MPIRISDVYADSPFAKQQTGLLFGLPKPDPSRVQLREGISLCMIVKNEETFLRACLESVAGVVDEILIVDTGSTDGTLDIAREFGAKIEFMEWRSDFAAARNESLKHASYRWTLSLDADEELTADSRDLVRSLRNVPAGDVAIYVQIQNVVEDVSGVATMSHVLPRLFPTTPRIRYRGVIHEGLTLDDGEIHAVLSPVKILHKGYTTELLTRRDKSVRNLALLQKAIELNANDLFTLYNFGNAAIGAEDPDNGIAALEKMFALGAEQGVTKTYFPLAYVMLATTYADRKDDLTKAEEVIATGLASFPKDVGIRFLQSQYLIRRKDYAAGRVILEDLLGSRQSLRGALVDDEIFEWKAFFMIAASYIEELDFEKALTYIDSAIVNKPNSTYLLVSRARTLDRLGRVHDADLTYRQYAELAGPTGYVEYINFLLRCRRFSSALRLIETHAGGASTRDSARMYTIAAKMAREQELGDPVPYLRSALQRAPGFGPALTLLEELLKERNAVDELAAMYEAELAAELVDADDHHRRAHRLLALERYEDARNAAHAGLVLEPENAGLLLALARASLHTGAVDEAIAALTRVAADRSEFSLALETLGALHLERAAHAAADAAYAQLLELQPQNINAILGRTKSLAGLGDTATAIALLQPHAALDRRIALELAGLLLGIGDFDGAGAVAAAALA